MLNLLIIKKRYPRLITAEMAATVVHSLLAVPIWCNWLFLFPVPIEHSAIERFSYIAGFLLWISSAHLINTLENTRLWLMYFDLQHLHYSKNQQWRAHIDTSESVDRNWFLRHRGTLGRPRYVITRAMIFYVVGLTLTFGSVIVLPWGDWAEMHVPYWSFTIVFSNLPSLLTVWTYYRCPQLSRDCDNFLFYTEFTAWIVLWSFANIVVVINTCLMQLGYILPYRISTGLSFIVVLNVPSLITFWWIPSKVRQDVVWRSDDAMLGEVILHRQRSDSNQEAASNAKSIGERLVEILVKEAEFDSFIEWMYRGVYVFVQWTE